MNILFAVFAITATIFFPGCGSPNVSATNTDNQSFSAPVTGTKTPVLVELFTSEGCSSCPPADRLLTTLDKEQPVDGAEVITLGFHVDYWDHGGWRDRFSSADYTRRQEDYGRHFGSGSYTPEAVIDGTIEAVGNNRTTVRDAIISRTSLPKAAITAEIVGDKMRINVSDIPATQSSTVYIVAAENGLVSNVSGGENSGSQLSHVSVVREMRAIGKIDAGQTVAKFEAPMLSNSGWKAANLRYVILVQENSTFRVIGVKRISQP